MNIISDSHRIISNSAFLIASRIVTKVATTLFIILIARQLGDESFGIYSSIVAFIALFSVIEEFGLTVPLIRSMATKIIDPKRLLGEIILIKIPLGFLALGLLIITALLVRLPLLITSMLGISMMVEMQAIAVTRSFEGRENMKIVALITIVERGIFFISGMIVLYMKWGLFGICSISIISNSIALIMGIIYFQQQHGPIEYSINRNRTKELMKEALPFVGSAIAAVLYLKIDIYLLASLSANAEVGWYNAAGRIIEAQMFIPVAIVSSIFPILSRVYKTNRQEFLNVHRYSFYILMVIGIVLTIISYSFASYIISILFGEPYVKSIESLKILSIMLPPYYLNVLLGSALIAANHEKLSTITILIGFIFNLILCALLIPAEGFIGASIARVATEIISFICQVWFVYKSLGTLKYIF